MLIPGSFKRLFDRGGSDKYLFIICMNNSGSTLLERVVSECRNGVGFPAPAGPDQQVNGQGFVADLMPIPGKITPKCRRIWSEQAAIFEDESNYDWPRIKRRWRKYWARNPKFAAAPSRVLLEKSPPDVYRTAMLQQHFRNSFFVLMQRNPYAVAEGIRRRAGLAIDRCIRHWIRCAQKQIENEQILRRRITLSYEQLSGEPDECRRRVVEFVPEFDDIDIRKDVAVHSLDGYVRQPITNYNAKQIARLAPADVDAINAELDRVPKVMQHFGYDYLRH
jgi:hypothetical protein